MIPRVKFIWGVSVLQSLFMYSIHACIFFSLTTLIKFSLSQHYVVFMIQLHFMKYGMPLTKTDYDKIKKLYILTGMKWKL